MNEDRTAIGVILGKWGIYIIVIAALFIIAGWTPSPEDMEMQMHPWTIPIAFALFLSVILADIIHDRMTYTYVSDDTRIHKKTGQKQQHIDVLTGFDRAKGWVNLKTDYEDDKT